MDKNELIKIGRKVYGKHWQTALAKELVITPQHLRKYVSGVTPIPPSKGRHIRIIFYLHNRNLLSDFVSTELLKAVKSAF